MADYYTGSLTREQAEQLLQALNDAESTELLAGSLSDWEAVNAPATLDFIYQSILLNHIADEPAKPVHRVHFLRRGWIRYAAALLLISFTAIYFYTTIDKEKPAVTQTPVTDRPIVPGSNRALLTLADGSTIVLDSAANGRLANEGGADIMKREDGQLAYEHQLQNSKEILWNTMRTPRGGQYQITLPDGTKVWLNAASSITFPVAFVDKERRVKITGEVYMEVAHNKLKPFFVDVDGKSSVEVLGTSFNINAYGDEGNISTTLIEGSIKMNNRMVLKPGQQAVQPGDSATKIISNADIAQVLAWKNGIFNFNGTDFKVVVRQLERWYDIVIDLRGKYDDMIMDGKMDRGVQLPDIIRFFNSYGFETKLEGRTLIVTRK